VGTKLRRVLNLGLLLAFAPGLHLLSGCGSGSGANVITISVTSSVGDVLILGQSTTLTATVTGATNTNVNWEACQYTTTTTSSSGSTTTSKPANCPTDGSFGTLSNEQVTGTATYTAPNQLPNQTTFPGLQLIFTAQSQQNTGKTGTVTITLTSGIAVHLTPTTATVPTNEPQVFFVTLDNDLQSKGVTWLVTQSTPTTSTPLSQLPTCSPGCGSIAPDKVVPNKAVYTAPATVPTSTSVTSTPANVTVVATSVADTTCSTCAVSGTITIIQGGPIAFNGISPSIAPQGAFYWDIYLDAPNLSSASQIAVNSLDSQGNITGTRVIDPNNPSFGVVKVLFPIPTATTTSPASTGGRLRLFAPALGTPGAFSITVSDPGETVTTPNPQSAYTFTVLPVRPTSTATVPDDVIQGTQADASVKVDGGYFGDGGGLARVFFQGNAIAQDTNNPSTAHQLHAILPASQINSFPPGLYPLSVASTSTVPPNPNNPAVTNMAIFPDYSPAVAGLAPTIVGGAVPAGTNPSAIDIDTSLGVVVVAETGSNQIQFYQIIPAGMSPETLTPIDSSGNPCAGSCPVVSTPQAPFNVPTGLSVNSSNHTVAVVNYGTQTGSGSNVTLAGQSVTVLPIPVPGAATQNPAPGTPFTIDISGAFQAAFQGSTNPIPLPYSIGVDPDSNLALVAFSSTSALSAANLGFIVNLNPNTQDPVTQKGTNPYGCALGQTISSTSNQFGQCIYAQVTLNTGSYPKIAVAPHSHTAYVTPGGSGVVLGIDVTKPSFSTPIASASATAGLVTVTTTQPHGLIPGNAGTVLITGVTSKTVDFNGVFTVVVTSNMTFTYALNTTQSDTGTGGTVFYGNPNQQVSISSTLQGIAMNPITRTAAMADANAIGTNGAQIDLLNSLDQSVSSISFFAGCTVYVTPCNTSPELLATTDVAWQPYTNAVVSYNPQQKLVSVSDPQSGQRQAIVSVKGPSAVAFPVTNGTTGTLTLWGGIVVDPATNHAFVLESGSGPQQPGQIEIINLGPSSNNIKPTQITELIVPGTKAGVLGGIPNALVPQATLTSTSDLANVRILGSGFGAPAVVRLDGVSITGPNFPTGTVTVVSQREIDVTIPAAFLSAPHRYAVDLTSTFNGSVVQSNTTDFIVVQAVDLSNVCAGTNAQPSGVAIADQVAKGPFSPIAVVTNSGCNSISVIDVNPTITTGGVTMPNPTFGKVLNTVAVGAAPQGIAITPRLGLAVVANNGGNDVSIVDLTQNPPVEKVADVPTGTAPIGVAINEATGAAIVANSTSNTVSLINLGLLFPPSGTTPPTSLTAASIGGIQQPIAVAIDPDRGANNQGIAVVTALQLNAGAAPSGALAVVDIGLSTPALSTTISSSTVSATPTGIVFDPSAATTTANPGVFYANSSGANVITVFNPDGVGGSSVNVGINPTSLAINSQTGAILTANSASNTISIVDTLSSPLQTLQTLGLPGSPTFGVAIDPFTNLAVIVDQANSRLLLFQMPN
jgi:DNA-binding beta-propeller fold protein YncE